MLDTPARGCIDVGIGKGTAYNEYEFVGCGLRSTDSRERMEERTVDILQRAWTNRHSTYEGRFHKVHVPAIRPKPVQQPGPPLWRSVISPPVPGMRPPADPTRLPVERIKERWATYAAGIDEGGHDAETKALLAQSALMAQRLCRGPGLSRGRAGRAAGGKRGPT